MQSEARATAQRLSKLRLICEDGGDAQELEREVQALYVQTGGQPKDGHLWLEYHRCMAAVSKSPMYKRWKAMDKAMEKNTETLMNICVVEQNIQNRMKDLLRESSERKAQQEAIPHSKLTTEVKVILIGLVCLILWYCIYCIF